MVAASAPHTPRAEITNRIVARVNSDIITLHELNAAIKDLLGASAGDLRKKNEARFYEVRKAVLDNLINEKIAEQEIVKLGITVTEKDIQEIAEGYLQVYLVYKQTGMDGFQFYLWVAEHCHVPNLIDQFRDKIDQSDLELVADIQGLSEIK